jgi:hypothetical protein
MGCPCSLDGYFGSVHLAWQPALALLMVTHIRTCLLLAIIALWPMATSFAQLAPTTIFQALSVEEMPKITLELDLTTVKANKKTNNYYPATLSLADGKRYEIEVKPRGKYRRKTCIFPPLKLKFKKKVLKAEGLDTLNDIKLVLPCLEDDRGDDLIVKEYLAYKMFEHVTEACVKVKLIKLTIIDAHTGKKKNVMAMLAEDEDETNVRMKGQVVEQYGLPLDSMLITQLATVVMFEYMIGNTDWDISMIRNVRTIRAPETGKVVVIPYDFDFSGFVSAPYASPASDTGLKNVRDRFLYSNGLTPEQLRRGTQRLLAARKEFVAICRNKYLSRNEQDMAIEYLESFFNKAESGKDMPTTLIAPPSD